MRRRLNLAGFLACAGLLAYALYTQHYLGLEPCPLCIFQRVGIFALGVVFLVAGLHNPRDWGRYVYSVLIALAALATIGVAGRHLYVQSLPAGAVPSCGAPLEVMLKFASDARGLAEVIRKVLVGGGECQQVNWTFMGLAMPAWVLLCAVVLGTFGVVANVRRTRPPDIRMATRAGSAAR